MADPTTEPVNDSVTNELEQQGDHGRDDSTEQHIEKGADEAASTSSGEG